MKNQAKSKKELSAADYEKIGRLIEDVVVMQYADKRRFFLFNFLRGVMSGLGIFIGGTIVVGIVLWVLNQFNDVPVIGPLVDKIVDTVNKTN